MIMKSAILMMPSISQCPLRKEKRKGNLGKQKREIGREKFWSVILRNVTLCLGRASLKEIT